MTENQTDPKQRILSKAANLMARKGYGSVGVREIAESADVNISMISYYFNGKVGILKAIIDKYFEGHIAVVMRGGEFKGNLEESVRFMVKNMVQYIRSNIDFAMIFFREIPIDLPEIANFKSKKISESLNIIGKLTGKVDIHPMNKNLLGIIGPAFISLVFSTFLFKPIIERAFEIKTNDEFYKSYSDKIATIILYGVTGLANETTNMKGN